MTSEKSKSDSSSGWSYLIILILNIIAIICYFNIDDQLAETCSVTEQKNYVLYQWICSLSMYGVILLSTFVLCCTGCSESGVSCFWVISCGAILLDLIAELGIMINLWVQDPLVSRFQLHTCADGKDYTTVTIIQIIPMIYQVIWWIIFGIFGIALLIGGCYGITLCCKNFSNNTIQDNSIKHVV